MNNIISGPILLQAFAKAENMTAAHFNGQTCSLKTIQGEDVCPICFFTARVKELVDEFDQDWERAVNNALSLLQEVLINGDDPLALKVWLLGERSLVEETIESLRALEETYAR